MRGGQLHGFVDGGGANVQSAAEDERKAQHVVHLVGIVGSAGGDDGVRPGLHDDVVGNLGIGIGEREDNGPLGHGQQHFRRDAIGNRQSDENVGAAHRFGESAHFRSCGEARFVGIHFHGAAFVDDPGDVAHEDVFALHAETEWRARRRRSKPRRRR